MNIRANGLAEIDARFRSHNYQLDLVLFVLAQAIEKRFTSVDCIGDSVFPRQVNRLLHHQEIAETFHIQATDLKQLTNIEEGPSHIDIHRLNAYAHSPISLN